MPTVNFTANKTNRIEDANATTNYSANAYIQVGEWNGGAATDRALIQFDLASIPVNSQITGVNLKLYDEGLNLSDNNRTMRVFRVLRTWVDSQSTWNIYSTGNSWGTAGCANTTTDREATDIGTITMPATEVAGYVTIPLTVSAIQAMIPGGSFTNNGFLLQMDTETNDMHQFSDQTVANQQPILEITYAGGSSAYFM